MNKEREREKTSAFTIRLDTNGPSTSIGPNFSIRELRFGCVSFWSLSELYIRVCVTTFFSSTFFFKCCAVRSISRLFDSNITECVLCPSLEKKLFLVCFYSLLLIQHLPFWCTYLRLCVDMCVRVVFGNSKRYILLMIYFVQIC